MTETAIPIMGQPELEAGAPSEVGTQVKLMPYVVADPKKASINVGGIMEVKSAEQVLEEQRAMADQENSAPVISGIAGLIRRCWDEARTAKEQTAEKDMVDALRQRNGEYAPDMYAELKSQSSTTIYMMITSSKCRAASAWLREALNGIPWGCEPTPISDIDQDTKNVIIEAATQELQKFMMMGIFPSNAEVKKYMEAVKDQTMVKIQEVARQRADRMTKKMQDQLIEGGFQEALDQFIDDLVTYPTAIIKGPIVRMRPQLKWISNPDGTRGVTTEDDFKLEWQRVSPFDIYPAPDAATVDDGYLIERHRLSKSDLVAMRDVDGYSAAAINAVLDDYGKGGLFNWTQSDTDRVQLEGKSSMALQNPSHLIDALQFWGKVSGKDLVDWGLSSDEVPDLLGEYNVEAWLIGNYVIKAMINPDPLGRVPYYIASWETIPGRFWGRSIPAICKDTQGVCNAAARAIVNNLGLASGPQVAVDTSRLPTGTDLSEMHPWKIWQWEDNGVGGSAGQPISFFQPTSIAGELMAIYEKFSQIADEASGLPRYMTGDTRVGGAGSTASGLSMLQGNASKVIRNVVASVDRMLKPAIERLYFFNMLWLKGPEYQDMLGDVNIVPKGVEKMLSQQNQQQRQLEAFNVAASNPVITQLIGVEGMSYMLREVLKPLGMDVDRIVPDAPILKARMAEQQLQQMAAMQAQAAQQQQAQGQPQAGGSPAKPGNNMDQRRLMNGEPQSVARVGNPLLK